ncbi:MAG TPA: hypothetical protein VNM37_23350 [Candidatus Dormibacteraeota bacterium]|nr:hypothetical protein [Candidatus Dormibacteraeota bacterium]
MLEGIEHPGLDRAFGNAEDNADLPEFEAFIMAQNNDHTIGFRKLEKRVTHGSGALAFDERLVWPRIVGLEGDGPWGFLVGLLQGEFAAAVDSAEFVITKV